MFTVIGSLESFGAPVLRREVITNSVVSTVGDSVKVASGFIALGTAGAAVFGHLSAHADAEQVGMTTTGATGAELGSYVGTFTAASNNQTVAQITAVCDISKKTLYSAEVDATIGTTTGSDLSMYHMDLVDEDTLDESTAATTAAQYLTWGTDPNNSAQAVVSIFESQVFN
ncbi:hypothetical protein KC850_03500 [Candidatus Kaiserbacteria bacterium]|nr:hypothetical protein [Candidatus Kaiserbacteria bacterium]